MATFVLIPGGWRGGWTFADFVARLNQSGHEAAAVTLSGLHAEHERSAAPVNLDTHIADVLDLLRLKDFSEVILCAHSYGGMVASGVADRAPAHRSACLPRCLRARTRSVLVGPCRRAFPESGNRPRPSRWPQRTPARGRRSPAPAPSARLFPSSPALPRAPAPMPRVFVYASGWSATPFSAQYQRLRDDPAWIVHSLACGHDVINAAPDEIFEILMQTAARLATT